MLSSKLNTYPFPDSPRVGLVSTYHFPEQCPFVQAHLQLHILDSYLTLDTTQKPHSFLTHTPPPSQTPLTPTIQNHVETITTLDPAHDLFTYSSMSVRDVEGCTPDVLYHHLKLGCHAPHYDHSFSVGAK